MRSQIVMAAALITLVAAACGSAEPAVTSSPMPITFDCELSGPSSEFEIRAIPGVDPAPTEFDGVNGAKCVFSEPVVSIKVLLFHGDGPVAGLLAYDEVIEISPSRTVEFPLAGVAGRKVLNSLLPLGRYTRRMEASNVNGAVVEIQTAADEVEDEIFLVDAPSATTMAR